MPTSLYLPRIFSWAGFLRRRAAPGYRFLTNVDAAELDTAQEAADATYPDGRLLILPRSYDAQGRRLPGVHAIYVRNDLPEPTAFWSYREFLKRATLSANRADGLRRSGPVHYRSV